MKTRISILIAVAAVWCLQFSVKGALPAPITLAWNPSASGNVATYILYWGTNSGTYVFSNSCAAPQTNLTISIFTNQMYYFAVAAVDSSGNQSANSAEAVYTPPVTPTAPTMTWNNPAAISYGIALGSSQLNASASVPGSFAYNPSYGVVLNTGTSTLSVVFTPSDTTDYLSVTNTANVVVTPTPLTVTAGNAIRSYGQANQIFSGTITGLQNNDNITAAYSSTATASSPAGNYVITPTLVDPGNRQTNYTVLLVNGTLTVSRVAAQVTWNNPASISYGTALSAAQLNATASVPGTFAYNPASGTVLNSGTDPLKVIFTPTDTTDYIGATNTASMVVSKVALTVTAANASRPYGQANPTFTGTITGLQNSDNITATYSSTATATNPLGGYTITPALVDPANRQTNYTVSLVNGTLTVAQAPPQVTWNNPASIPYGTALSAAQLNATASVPGTFAYNPASGAALNSGTVPLKVVFTPTDTTDYTSATNTVSMVVSKGALTVTAANANRSYGQANPTLTGTISGLQNSDNITATYSSTATATSPVGGYTITPTLVDPANRQTNYTVNLVNGTLTVAQVAAQVTWNNPASIPYGTALSAAQLNATASVPGTFAYNPASGTALNSGTTPLKVVFTPTDTTDYIGATNTVNEVVSRTALTVTAANANRPYGQSNPTFTGTITGLQNSDNITATYSSTATATSPVGGYTITPTLVDPANRQTNYTVNLVNGTLTVAQIAAQVTWNNPASIPYGTALSAAQLNATASVPGTFAYNPASGTVLNSGTTPLKVVFTPTDTTDYIGATNTVNEVVSRTALTVTAANANRPYGQSNPTFTGTITGLQSSDNITATYSSTATASSPAGSYTITPTLADPGNRQTNYTVNLVDGTLTVTQAGLVITWTNPAPVVYGTLLSSNQLNATATVPGSFVYNPTNGAALGTGTNVLSAIFNPTDTADYSSVTNTVSLVVSPAPLTVTAADANRPYGQSNPTFTGSITGLQNGDNVTATYSSTATATSPAGGYTITPALVDPANRQTNYTVSLVGGTLSVGQALPPVTWNNPASFTYGTALSAAQLNATASVPGTFAYNPAGGTVLNSGTTPITVVFTPTDTTDYSSATNTVTMVVAQAALTVTAANANRSYGQANPTFTGTIGGLQNGDNITAIYSSTAAASSPVGSYTITPTLVDPANRQTNYTVSLVNGTLTVAQVAAEVTWNNPVAITYGTALSAPQLNATASVPGTFAYNPAVGTALNSGTTQLKVIFTPTDTTDYIGATNTVSEVVSRAALTVTAANANRSYGQANPTFTGTIGGLQNGDNITATYSSTATSSSPVGSYTITPTLVDPANRQTNYTVSLANGTLTVAQTGVSVTWANPTPVVYGTALSTNELNAMAGVPGNFVYNPTNGALLDTGTNLITAIFTPSDMTDYNSVTDTVSLVVLPAPLTVTAANTNRPFSQPNPTFTGNINGLQNSDNITATYSCAATTSSPAGSYTITPALVDPANRQTNYTVNLVDGTLTVGAGQTLPQVTWNTPAPITYGASLGAAQLNATVNVPGSFAYNPPIGTLPNSGAVLLTAVFTPTDTADYIGATNTVSLSVVRAALNVTAGNATRAYGQANPTFTGTITGLQNGDNITANYSSTATTSSPVGGYTITPTLVDPANRQTNYTVSLVNGTLTVGTMSLRVTWNAPSSITYGAPLSAAQLNATANVPGTFAYNPPIGTVPSAGTVALSAVFTPSDTNDYSSVTAGASLVVSPAPLVVTANDNSRAYGATNPAFNGTITGLTNGDNIAATYGCAAASNSPVGIYAITPTLSDPDNREINYSISLVGGALTIYAVPQSTNQIAGIPPMLNMIAFGQQPNLVISGTLGAQMLIQANTNIQDAMAWTTIDTVTLTNAAISSNGISTNGLPALLASAFAPALQLYTPAASNFSGALVVYRATMPYDYATLAYQVLPAKSYPSRLIAVFMPGLSDNVCYVTNQYNYLYCVEQNLNVAVQSSGPTIREIASSLAGVLNQSWTSAQELSYSNGVYQSLATVIETDPPSSDQVAGQQPPATIQINF